MAADGDQTREQTAALDRVGLFFGDVARVTQAVWERNLTLWSTVSSRVRQEKKYGADELANDTGQAMVTAIDNLEDIWTFWTRIPQREQVATSVPTAFLYFQARDDAEAPYALSDSVLIRVPPGELKALPDRAEIDLSGPEKGLPNMRKCLRVTRQPTGYLLEPADIGRLTPGVYGGVVYVPGLHPRLLATLRIVVEREPGA
jgi:hypothetical protein